MVRIKSRIRTEDDRKTIQERERMATLEVERIANVKVEIVQIGKIIAVDGCRQALHLEHIRPNASIDATR